MFCFVILLMDFEIEVKITICERFTPYFRYLIHRLFNLDLTGKLRF